MTTPPQPIWQPNGVPFCDEEYCPHFDGKRCGLLGFSPCRICEPAVIQMAEVIKNVKAAVHDPSPSLV